MRRLLKPLQAFVWGRSVECKTFYRYFYCWQIVVFGLSINIESEYTHPHTQNIVIRHMRGGFITFCINFQCLFSIALQSIIDGVINKCIKSHALSPDEGRLTHGKKIITFKRFSGVFRKNFTDVTETSDRLPHPSNKMFIHAHVHVQVIICTCDVQIAIYFR